MSLDLEGLAEDNDIPQDIEISKEEINAGLIAAAKLGKRGIVLKCLKEYNADVNYEDEHGWTALFYASYYGYHRVVEVLLAYGASHAYQELVSSGLPSIQPGSPAALLPNYRIVHSPLHWAIQRGQIRVVWLLLLAGYSTMDLDSNGNSSLHLVCMSTCPSETIRYELMITIMGSGFDPLLKNWMGKTPADLLPTHSTRCRKLLAATIAQQRCNASEVTFGPNTLRHLCEITYQCYTENTSDFKEVYAFSPAVPGVTYDIEDDEEDVDFTSLNNPENKDASSANADASVDESTSSSTTINMSIMSGDLNSNANHADDSGGAESGAGALAKCDANRAAVSKKSKKTTSKKYRSIHDPPVYSKSDPPSNYGFTQGRGGVFLAHRPSDLLLRRPLRVATFHTYRISDADALLSSRMQPWLSALYASMRTWSQIMEQPSGMGGHPLFSHTLAGHAPQELNDANSVQDNETDLQKQTGAPNELAETFRGDNYGWSGTGTHQVLSTVPPPPTHPLFKHPLLSPHVFPAEYFFTDAKISELEAAISSSISAKGSRHLISWAFRKLERVRASRRIISALSALTAALSSSPSSPDVDGPSLNNVASSLHPLFLDVERELRTPLVGDAFRSHVSLSLAICFSLIVLRQSVHQCSRISLATHVHDTIIAKLEKALHRMSGLLKMVWELRAALHGLSGNFQGTPNSRQLKPLLGSLVFPSDAIAKASGSNLDFSTLLTNDYTKDPFTPVDALANANLLTSAPSSNAPGETNELKGLEDVDVEGDAISVQLDRSIDSQSIGPEQSEDQLDTPKSNHSESFPPNPHDESTSFDAFNFENYPNSGDNQDLRDSPEHSLPKYIPLGISPVESLLPSFPALSLPELESAVNLLDRLFLEVELSDVMLAAQAAQETAKQTMIDFAEEDPTEFFTPELPITEAPPATPATNGRKSAGAAKAAPKPANSRGRGKVQEEAPPPPSPIDPDLPCDPKGVPLPHTKQLLAWNKVLHEKQNLLSLIEKGEKAGTAEEALDKARAMCEQLHSAFIDNVTLEAERVLVAREKKAKALRGKKKKKASATKTGPK